MDGFDDPLKDEKFDSLADALHALGFSLCEELLETETRLKSTLSATPLSAARVSRLSARWITLKYACDTFMEMEDPFTPAGVKIAALYDDPAYLPELMDGVLLHIKFMHASGGLLKSGMVLLPSHLEALVSESRGGSKIMPPALDRNEVTAGNAKAIQWLETDLLPLFKGLCPPRGNQQPPSLPWSAPSL